MAGKIKKTSLAYPLLAFIRIVGLNFASMLLQEKALLLYADSSSSADMLYFSGIFVPDPFMAFKFGSQTLGLFNALEFARAKKESSLSKVLSYEVYQEKAVKKFQTTNPTPAHLIATVAAEFKTNHFSVPGDFPLGLALLLKDLGLNLHPSEGSLFPERDIKDKETAQKIKEGNKASAAGIKAAKQALAESKIKGGKLYLKGKLLTSERLRTLVNIACLERGALAKDTIVAGGIEACDPHCRGSGVLRAHELIIIDVFPRIEKTGYFGDMTRTVLKGQASEAQTQLVKTVIEAQKLALKSLQPGRKGSEVHQQVQDFFNQKGYKTEARNGLMEGFIHGTGHGLGLEVHEGIRLGPRGAVLQPGHVVTVEPGLYYRDLGGCRIEDVAWIQEKGHELLSQCPYNWVIP